MKIALEIIHQAAAQFTNPVISFSGGGDSTVLLDLIYRKTGYRFPVIFADSHMEYPETLPHVKNVCKEYGAELLIAEAPREPLEQWQRYGWAMLGKMSARLWMQKNKNKEFRLDVTGCCRSMKIAPARKLMRKAGYDLQFTGQRGGEDDRMRALRELKDGAIKEIKADKISVCNPLLGWTDLMIRRYTEQNHLPIHPAKSRGAKTIGCMYCGGGAQFDNSGFRVLRHSLPEAWRDFMVTMKAGEIVLAIKYKATLSETRRVIENLGGLAKLADERPWVFDFLKVPPLRGYIR